MKRPQPYRLSWAKQLKLPDAANTALARQFTNADQMFEILFRDFGNPGAGPFAPIASPALTGVPTAPTAVLGTDTTQLATTEFVNDAVSTATAGGPFAPIASPALTGVPTAPTAAPLTSTTQLATTEFVTDAVAAGGGGGVPVLTQGSIPFADSAGAITEDNANLFFDETNKRTGLGTNTPTTTLQVHSPAAVDTLIRVSNTGGARAGIRFTDSGNVYGQIDFDGISNDLWLRGVQSNSNVRVCPGGGVTPTATFTDQGKLQIGVSGLTPSRGGTLLTALATAPTGLTADEAYVNLGGGEFGTPSYRTIAFGWFNNASVYQPAYIAYKETSSGGNTHGDLIFGTRSGIADVVPDEVLRITSDGNVAIGAVVPTARLHLPAGAAGAGLAQLKLEPSVLLATPEIGALEFTDDGTTGHLYITVNVAGIPTRVQIV